MLRPLTISLSLLLTVVATSTAFAQDSVECVEYVPADERNDAKRLALRGVSCFEKGDYIKALRHYRRAREISDANLFNAAIGRTFHELGYPYIARRYYRDYLAGKIEETGGREKIEGRLADVEKQLDEKGGTMRVETTPPGATVKLVVDESHWEDLGESPIEVGMTEGKHTVVVEREGAPPQEHTVAVKSGRTEVVRHEFHAADNQTFDVSKRKMRQIGVITAGASLPVLGAGASLFFIGRNQRSSVDEHPIPEQTRVRRSAMRLQNAGIVVMSVGGVALVTGVTLFIAGSRGGGQAAAKTTPKTAWIPWTDGRVVGLSYRF